MDLGRQEMGRGKLAHVSQTRVQRSYEPDLDAEQEIDLRSLWSRIAARWWLLVLGIVLGAVAGYLLALGGGQVYRATALMVLAQPFSPGGGSPVLAFLTNPRAVSEIINSEAALRQAANSSKIPVDALRSNVSTATVGASGAGARVVGAPLVTITVLGSQPRKVELAANRLARVVVARTTTEYVETKIRTFKQQLASAQEQLDSLVPRITALEVAIRQPNLEPLEALVLISSLDNQQQRRGQLLNLQAGIQQQLALAESVERAQIIQPAVAAKTTAQSTRNAALVGALVGLLLAVAAALAADPFLARRHGATA